MCSQVTSNPVTVATIKKYICHFLEYIFVCRGYTVFGPQRGYQKVQKEHTDAGRESFTATVFGGASVRLQFSTEEK